MFIHSLSEPFHYLPFDGISRRGTPERCALPFHRGLVDRLPEGIDALICASDLQGLELGSGGTGRLLGEALADELILLAKTGSLPRLDRVGILLAGDLFALGHKRGGLGDVRQVWTAFRDSCVWVVGVPGNHDAFGKPKEEAEFRRSGGLHFLDGDLIELGGVRVAGLGGIIGNPRRPWRRSEDGFVDGLVDLLAAPLAPPPAVS